MDLSLPMIKNLPGKSLILSVIGHVLIFSTFVFVWPNQPQERKPHFNFLGSILSAADVMIPGTGPEPEGGTSVNYQFQDTSSSLFDTRLPKPIHHPQYGPEQKRTVKEINSENPPVPTEYHPPSDVRIETEIEPYKPLRLKVND